MAKNKLPPIMIKIGEFYLSSANVTAVSGTSLKFNTTTYSSRQFHKRLIKDEKEIALHVGRSDYYDFVDGLVEKNNTDVASVMEKISDRVFTAMHSHIQSAKTQKTAGSVEVQGANYSYANKIPILDRKSGERLLFDTANQCIDHGTDYDTWKEYRSYQDKDTKEIMGSVVRVAEIDYNPFDTQEIATKEINGQEGVLCINAHRTPKWRTEELEDPKLPEAFVKFMNHLFSDQDSIDYVYNWLRNMILDRNHTMLLLHGGRGIGKNTFSTICRSLMGDENFGIVASNFFNVNFNGVLKHKRCVLFDEFDVRKENMPVWKTLPERYIAIEDKNIKVATYENFSSFLICNNTEHIVDLLCDERKFSVPNVPTFGKVNEALGDELFDSFSWDIANDQETIANIGWWLIKNGESDKYDNRKPFISNTFHEIVEKALTNWQRELITEITRCEYEVIYMEDIENILKGTGRTKVEKFLQTHFDVDGDFYAYIRSEKNGRRAIVPNDKYLPENVINTYHDDKDEDETADDDIDFENMEF